MKSSPKYWIAVVSKDHAMRGVTGGFIQINHGKEAPLKRLKPADWIIIYSPKLSMDSEQKCQAFTAIGQVTNDPIYQFSMSETFVPFRRNITFFKSDEVSITPLITELDFIENKKSWGYPFRFGFFEINERDFELISRQMLKNTK